MTARRKGKDTRARRPAATGLTARQQLANELKHKQCIHCGQRAWKVTRTVGRIRYLICLGCQQPSKIALKAPKENATDGKEKGGKEDKGTGGKEESASQ